MRSRLRLVSSFAFLTAAAVAAVTPSALAQSDRTATGRAEPFSALTLPADVFAGGMGGLALTADSDGEGNPAENAWDIPGQYIVDAKDDLSPADLARLASDFGLSFTPTQLESETKEELATVPASLVARLVADPRVEGVEPLARVRAFFTNDDPLMKDQWHLTRVNAPRAWDFATGRGVTVAVVDTGIACETYGPYTKGTDLAETTCVTGYSFVTKDEHANDDQGHGTHVAGTIAQSTNNGIGGAGMAFHARLMPVKVLNGDGWGTTADVADGIRWAAEHGAQVINLSLGGPRNSKVLQKAIDYAISQGAVVVAAAGNTGGHVQFPGASDGVIGVSATDENDKIAKFSSRGDGVDIAAPGVNVIQQTICNKGRDKCERFPNYSGTSMASPHVAGAAALLVSLGVTDPVKVEEALRAGARKVDDSAGADKLYGAGILDAAASAARVTATHAIVRLVALLGLAGLIGVAAKRRNAKASSPWTLAFWLPALAAGPGLFFFAPWILPRVNLLVDVAARPIADMDLLVGVGLHRLLPLANVAVPFALTAVAFGVKQLRPVVAGIAVGTAAYLASVVVLRDAAGPFGTVPMLLWCAANAVGCLWVARTNLAEVD